MSDDLIDSLLTPQWLMAGEDISPAPLQEHLQEFIKGYFVNTLQLSQEEMNHSLKSVQILSSEVVDVSASGISIKRSRKQITEPNGARPKTSGTKKARQLVLGPIGSPEERFATFAPSVQKAKTRAGKEEIKDCELCKANGIITCDGCGGRPYTDCLACSTTGSVACRGCVGGRVRCTQCAGSGTRGNCGSCKGAGCWSCGNTGRSKCFYCSGSGEAKCGDCHGRGESMCQRCVGEGQLVCDDCHGRGNQTCGECEGHRQFITFQRSEVEVALGEPTQCLLSYSWQAGSWRPFELEIPGALEIQSCWFIRSIAEISDLPLPATIKDCVIGRAKYLLDGSKSDFVRLVVRCGIRHYIQFSLSGDEHAITVWEGSDVTVELSPSLSTVEVSRALLLCESLFSSSSEKRFEAFQSIEQLPINGSLRIKLFEEFSKRLLKEITTLSATQTGGFLINYFEDMSKSISVILKQPPDARLRQRSIEPGLKEPMKNVMLAAKIVRTKVRSELDLKAEARVGVKWLAIIGCVGSFFWWGFSSASLGNPRAVFIFWVSLGVFLISAFLSFDVEKRLGEMLSGKRLQDWLDESSTVADSSTMSP